MDEIHFSGRMNDPEFLSRLYDLKNLPSNDSRYEDAAGDIWLHTVNNNDYEGNWAFLDSRFQLLEGQDEIFLRFLCEMAHPLVRPNNQEASKVYAIANDWLKSDGWELYPVQKIAGGNIVSYRKLGAQPQPTEDDVAHIWNTDKLRFFVSHRDKHKVSANKLSGDLESYGISCFVAHDSIQSMSTWKNEIMKALQTMDACLCFITNDFYESEWTNQEIGFALAKGVPIYLYSVDKTDPKGFKMDTQAIKAGFPDLVTCIKKDFSTHNKFKNTFIQNFTDSINGTYDRAKNRFFDLVGFEFNDSEIEKIAEGFLAKANSNNQLIAILNDLIKEDHRKHPRLKKYTHYRDYLTNDIFSQHSTKLYSVVIDKSGRVSIEKQTKKN